MPPQATQDDNQSEAQRQVDNSLNDAASTAKRVGRAGLNRAIKLASNTKRYAAWANKARLAINALRAARLAPLLANPVTWIIIGILFVLLIIVVILSNIGAFVLPNLATQQSSIIIEKAVQHWPAADCNIDAELDQSTLSPPTTPLTYANDDFDALDPACFRFIVTISIAQGEDLVTINNITDVVSLNFTPLATITAGNELLQSQGGSTELSALGANQISYEYTYLVENPASEDFDDSIIQNTVTVNYTVPSEDTASPALTQGLAQIIIGTPASAGCWPVTGSISQLPFGSVSHATQDAFDIGASLGSPVIAPYDGTVRAYYQGDLGGSQALCEIPDPTNLFFGYRIADIPQCTWWGAGNMVVLVTSQGAFLFEHLNSIAVTDNQAVTAGTIIGEVGTTGYSSGAHLHYELRSSWPGTSAGGPPSVLSSIVPSDTTGLPVTRVGQPVSATSCVASAVEDPDLRVGCFVFSQAGDKDWTQEEIDQVSPVLLSNIIDDPVVESLVCDYGDVTLTRTGSACQDAGGPWAGFTSINSIQFCDNLFGQGGFQNGTFGRYTVVHEPFHIIQLRNAGSFRTALSSFYNLFNTRGATSFYDTTYPYDYEAVGTYSEAKLVSENTAEAFSYCRIGDGSYRGTSQAPTNVGDQCGAIETILINTSVFNQ